MVKYGYVGVLRRNFCVGHAIIEKNILREYVETVDKTIEISKEIW